VPEHGSLGACRRLRGGGAKQTSGAEVKDALGLQKDRSKHRKSSSITDGSGARRRHLTPQKVTAQGATPALPRRWGL